MKRHMLEEYLDGGLSAADAAVLQRALAGDTGLAAELDRVRGERAMRAAALASYAPSTDEAAALALRIMDAARDTQLAPVGRIGWMRKAAGIAAMLAIAAGSFYAGRATSAPGSQIAGTTPPVVAPAGGDDSHIIVVVQNSDGTERERREFTSREAAESFAREVSPDSGEVSVAGVL